MSSGLGVASVEGREWDAFFERVDVHRPHFAAYSDTAARSLAYSIAMLELQRGLRPAGLEVAPEIENWPDTEWTKSDTQTWSEMVAARLSGASGLLLDVFPFVTGDPGRYPRVGRMLTRSRPAVEAAATPEFTTEGVGIPWHQDTAAHVWGDGTLGGLQADPLRAAEYLLPYGIPVTSGASRVNALFGKVAWGVPAEQVAELLAGGLLLDGHAALVLAERGFGHLLGVIVEEVAERHTPARQPYSMERIGESGELLSVNIQPALARLAAADGAQVWTEILTPRGEHWGDGRVAFENALGGRVLTMAACTPEALGRCDDGQRLAQAAIRFLGGTFPMVTGGPHLLPQLARIGDRWRLAVANGSADPATPVVEGVPDNATATLLTPLSEPAPADLATVELPHRGYLLLEW